LSSGGADTDNDGEISIAARGDIADGLSAQAARDAAKLFENDGND